MITEEQISANAEKYKNIMLTQVKRDGIQDLLNYMQNETDFFMAPASSQYHCSYKGGLVVHSINVYERIRRVCRDLPKEFLTENNKENLAESATLVSLLHDLCKANFYKVDFKNVKDEETGKWSRQPYYKIDEQFPYGHGEKSVFLINKFMTLTDIEGLAIRWHMGAFDSAVKGGDKSLNKAFEQNPLCVALHIADMEATYFDEVEQ